MLSILCIRMQFGNVIDQKVIQMRARPMKDDSINWKCSKTNDIIPTSIFSVLINSESKFDSKEIHDFIVYCN